MIRMLKHVPVNLIILLAFVIILIWKPIVEEYRNYSDNGPWFTAKLAIRPGHMDNSGSPIVLYTKQIDRVLNGAWAAWLVTVDGEKVTYYCGGSGRGIYSPTETGTREYSFRYFLGQNCDAPSVPYRLCAEWIMSYNGRERFIGPVCSSIMPGFTKRALTP